MMGPFPILQVVVGMVGALGGFVLGFRLFSPQKVGISWVGRQARFFGAMMIMTVGFGLGQIIGYSLNHLIVLQ